MKNLILVFFGALLCAQEKLPTVPATTPNVELTVYLLSGAAQGTADEVPQDLAATVKQLHALFNYKSYKLSESFVLRGRASQANRHDFAKTQGILPGAGLNYNFQYNSVSVSDGRPRMVHIDGLQINLHTPETFGPDNKPRSTTVASIITDLDLADGQKTVVGKSSINNVGDALILVIVPKVIE